VQVEEGGESVPVFWASAHSGDAHRDFNVLCRKINKLPMQDNHCDCGLFLLTYVDFFTHGLPAAIRFSAKKQIDFTELEGAWGCLFRAARSVIAGALLENVPRFWKMCLSPGK
jgi:hypothetical protein